MNEAEPVAEKQSATPSAAPAQANGSNTDDLHDIPLLPRHLRNEETAAKPVLNPALDETDLKLSLQVIIEGRMTRIMDCNFAATAFGGLNPVNRGVIFQSLDRLTEEALQAAAIKLNAAAPVPELSQLENHDRDDIDCDPALNRLKHQNGANSLMNGAPGD